MRPAEFVLLVVTVVGVVRPATSLVVRRSIAWPVAAAATIAAVAHLTVEGARWQLTPLYLAAAVVLLISLADAVRPPNAASGRVGWLLLGALAATGGVLGWALPVPALPAPTGPQPVGTTVVSLTDPERRAGYGAEPGGARELALQVWYPADPQEPVAPGAWVPAGARFGRQAAAWLGMPSFVLDHVGLVRGHATDDVAASPEPGPLPVVVYSHGWGGFRTIQSGLAEDLASRGYVVAALDHTHGAVATAFPDGQVVPIDPAALPSETGPEIYDAAAERLVATFAADVAFALDELDAGAVPMLAGRLDLDAVGIVGHSTGGGAAVRFCAEDRRCGAVVGFDPWVEPVPDDILGHGLDVPFLALRSEEWVGNDNDARLRRLRASSNGPSGLVAVAGTTHRDVTLLPFLSPLSHRLGLAGVTPGERTHALTTEWTAAWLDHHLRGALRDPLLDPPAYREAQVDG
ncbi:MAG: dienelactone hydrolase family protein [Nitriliruptor sp.]